MQDRLQNLKADSNKHTCLLTPRVISLITCLPASATKEEENFNANWDAAHIHPFPIHIDAPHPPGCALKCQWYQKPSTPSPGSPYEAYYASPAAS